MTKYDIGLKLLSLYQDLTKSYHNNELSKRIKGIIESIRQDDLKDTGLEILGLDEPSILFEKPDMSIEGRIRLAIFKHKGKYGSNLHSNELNLIRQICREFDVDYENVI